MGEKSEKLWNTNYLKVWTANFMLFFSFMVLTPLLPLYMSETYGAGKHTIGLVLSGYTLTALLVRSLSGYLVDRFPRKIVLLICYALFCIFFMGYFFTAWSLLMFTILRTLHGAPFGAVTVANSTVAIDVLHPSRRAEGIGYYGLSNNIATAISPSVGLYIYQACGNYNMIFLLSVICSAIGLCIDSTLKLPPRPVIKEKKKLSFDRFFLFNGWSEGISLSCFAFSYGILSTYLAIYGKEKLGILGGTGLFFMILSIGLILSRLIGSHSLREGKIVQNVSVGILISLCGYLLFAAFHTFWAYYGAALIIGLGNGHMFPGFQNMFVNLASHTQRGTANSMLLTSWDLGIGMGILAGGTIAETSGYSAAFWWAWIINACGVIFFFAYVRKNYLKNKLR
ncbi:MAG: MFS transporter [Bacteroidaceae bacterium]|jgi:predicted MFS family arabinose efflux permease|nr:MFS transporter [Bacteroidaceae bacterium]